MKRSIDLSRRGMIKVAGVAGAIGVSGGIGSASGAENHQKIIKELRAATSKYQDLEKAEADGYHLEEECISHEDIPGADEGAMGYHAINGPLIDTTLRETEPEILVYEKKGNQFNLVAVEFASTHSPSGPAPTIFGHEMHPAPPSLPFNWELHVWAWKNNPSGLFADLNPRVECP